LAEYAASDGEGEGRRRDKEKHRPAIPLIMPGLYRGLGSGVNEEGLETRN